MPQANSLNHPLAGRLLRAAATRMKHAVSRFALAALGVVALYRAPAVAQAQARAQQIQVYDGELLRRSSDRNAGVRPRSYRIVGYAVPDAGYAGTTCGWSNRGGRPTSSLSAYRTARGATANLGIATKYYVTTNLFWDLGIRYRSVDRVVSLENTLLTTAGAGTA